MLYNNKYRIDSSRLKKWDYRSEGIYFITICTQYMDPVFVYIDNSKMILSEIGIIVDNYWCDIPKHFQSIELDEYIVMPNHIHGIIIIPPIETLRRDIHPETIKTMFEIPQKIILNQFMSKISPKKGSISVIIRSYKSICTNAINKECNSGKFKWQTRFYDYVIRTENDLIRIRKYIKNNPAKWDTKSK